jgi:Leucine-rich repeat (LRR) protein
MDKIPQELIGEILKFIPLVNDLEKIDNEFFNDEITHILKYNKIFEVNAFKDLYECHKYKVYKIMFKSSYLTLNEKILPSNIGDLSSLMELELNGCKKIPSSIGKLKITKLTVKNCDELPITMVNMINLNELVLEVVKIPQFINELHKLKKLMIIDSIIHNFNLSNLNDLKSLTIFNCQLNDIILPNGITYLKITRNNLANFYYPFNTILYLDLSNNKINKIDIGNLTNLNTLMLDVNELKYINGLEHLTNLTFLSLSSNLFEDLTDLNYLTDITYLNISNNNIQKMNIKNLTKLGTLYIDKGLEKYIYDLPKLSLYKS